MEYVKTGIGVAVAFFIVVTLATSSGAQGLIEDVDLTEEWNEVIQDDTDVLVENDEVVIDPEGTFETEVVQVDEDEALDVTVNHTDGDTEVQLVDAEGLVIDSVVATGDVVEELEVEEPEFDEYNLVFTEDSETETSTVDSYTVSAESQSISSLLMMLALALAGIGIIAMFE